MKYVAIDLETANDERSSICAIGLAKFKNGEMIDQFYSLVNPEVDYFSHMNIQIHGITEEDVKDKPSFENIIRDVEEFIEDYPLVAHFSQFDMYALEDAYRKYDLNIPSLNYFCSYRLSKNLYQLSSYRLPSMCSYFNIDSSNHHNALSDAIMCGLITTEILKDKQLDLEAFNSDYRYSLGILGRRGYLKKKNKKYKSIELNVDESKFQIDHELYQKNICFTGALQGMTRAEAAQIVTDIGANFNKGITKQTNFLVIGDLENLEKTTGAKKSSKIIKAEKLSVEGQEIEILSEIDFIKLLN